MQNESLKPNVVVLCGPTAVGKTAISIEMAKLFNGEIISADSMQIYRYMDIGTAKPTVCERAAVSHHIIDIIDPDEPFDAAKYGKMAHDIIIKLNEKGTVPFVAGGTGLYIKALVHGLFRAAPYDLEIRKRLIQESNEFGSDFLYNRLRAVDPKAARRIHPNDIYRIIRALEIYEVSGNPISIYHQAHAFKDHRYRVLKFGLNVGREALYDRINLRVDNMIESGFVQEVRELLNRGYPKDLKPMQSIGYRHMVSFLEGRVEWDEAIRTLKRDTRRYAKRQMTWFRKDPDLQWKDPDNLDEIIRITQNFLKSG